MFAFFALDPFIDISSLQSLLDKQCLPGRYIDLITNYNIASCSSLPLPVLYTFSIVMPRLDRGIQKELDSEGISYLSCHLETHAKETQEQIDS